jgi:hypothetical protein
VASVMRPEKVTFGEMRASGVRGIQTGKAPVTMLLRISCLIRFNFAGLRCCIFASDHQFFGVSLS